MTVRIGTVGCVFRVTIKDEQTRLPINLSSATVKQLVMTNQYGSRKTFDCAFTTDGTDGTIQYTTISGDLSASGIHTFKAYIVTPTLSGYTSEFDVPITGAP